MNGTKCHQVLHKLLAIQTLFMDIYMAALHLETRPMNEIIFLVEDAA